MARPSVLLATVVAAFGWLIFTMLGGALSDRIGRVRYSGISIGYALGAILGGAFAATIAQWLLNTTGWSPSIGIYIMVLCVISFVAVSMVKETRGNSLRVEGLPPDTGTAESIACA